MQGDPGGSQPPGFFSWGNLCGLGKRRKLRALREKNMVGDFQARKLKTRG
jgi:hypothetical protein